MKKLSLTFLNEDGKKATFSPLRSKEDLTAATVQEVMEGMIAIGLVEKNGVQQYAKVDSAKYTETIVTPIF